MMQILPDPRCPLCGRAVIGEAVHGNEGSYHPECTKPAPPPWPPSPFYPWATPALPEPTQFQFDHLWRPESIRC